MEAGVSGELQDRLGSCGDEAVAAELLASIEDFTSASSVNLFLGNLVSTRRWMRFDPLALACLSALNKELDAQPPIYEGGGTSQKHPSTTCGETNHS